MMANSATVSTIDTPSDSDRSATHPQDNTPSHLNPSRSMKLARTATFYDLISSAGSVAQLLKTLEEIKNTITI
jgi:hypothetical protein